MPHEVTPSQSILSPHENVVPNPLSIRSGTYYRSRVLSAQCGLNPMVTASHALMTLLTQLQSRQTTLNLEQLITNLDHELLTFESRAQAAGCSAEHINLAKFILLHSFSESLHEAVGQKLLEHYFPQKKNRDRWTVLTHLMQDPKPHLELLELNYLCMSLTTQNNALIANPVQPNLDTVYHLIRTLRGDKPVEFSLPAPAHTSNFSVKRRPPLVIITLTCITGFLLLCGGLKYMVQLNKSLLPPQLILSKTEPASLEQHDNF